MLACVCGHAHADTTVHVQVQEYGLRKHACYGVFVKDVARVCLHECEVCNRIPSHTQYYQV